MRSGVQGAFAVGLELLPGPLRWPRAPLRGREATAEPPEPDRPHKNWTCPEGSLATVVARNGLCDLSALDDAGLRLLDRLLSDGQIRPGSRVLEIGNGWGSLLKRIRETVDGVHYGLGRCWRIGRFWRVSVEGAKPGMSTSCEADLVQGRVVLPLLSSHCLSGWAVPVRTLCSPRRYAEKQAARETWEVSCGAAS